MATTARLRVKTNSFHPPGIDPDILDRLYGCRTSLSTKIVSFRFVLSFMSGTDDYFIEPIAIWNGRRAGHLIGASDSAEHSLRNPLNSRGFIPESKGKSSPGWKRNTCAGSLRWNEKAGLLAGCVQLPVRNGLEAQKNVLFHTKSLVENLPATRQCQDLQAFTALRGISLPGCGISEND